MNTHDDTPACILLAQAQFEERQRLKAAVALEAEAASAAKAATDDEAVQKLLNVFKTLPDSQECSLHPGQTAATRQVCKASFSAMRLLKTCANGWERVLLTGSAPVMPRSATAIGHPCGAARTTAQ